MRRVKDIMVRDFVTVDINETLQRAAQLMVNDYTNCLPVMYNDKFMNLISMRDIWSSVGKSLVRDIPARPVSSIRSLASIFEAKELMDIQGAEKLAVVDNGELVGLLQKPELYFEIGKNVDELTGLHKKEYILYMCERLMNLGQEFCVAFIDINNFGHIDKTYGHVAGDNVLKCFSLMLEENKPEGSVLCRFGGDEFVLIIPACLEEGKRLVNNLLRKASRVSFISDIEITATAGIAAYTPYKETQISNDETILTLINYASLASTKAKKSRHRLEVVNSLFE